jgi:phage terminase large subunit
MLLRPAEKPNRAEVAAKLPGWSRVLFEPQWRYISVRGGRGSGKTVNFARSLLIRASQTALRVLCTREVQETIAESVYATLVAEIKVLGLGACFEVLSNEIRCIAPGCEGGKFIFKGLNDLTADGIKSMADINVCWVEEAQTLTERTLRMLSPTIRAPGSQIWFSWNAVLETDPIYQAVVVKKSLPKCANLFINFDRNPWFPAELRLEEQTMAANDPVMHRHVWLGECLPAVEGAIYFHEIATMEREGRIINMVHDETLNTYAVFDLGFNDYTSCGLVQVLAGEKRIIDFIENHRVPLSWFSTELTSRGYTGSILVMPHDARHKTLAGAGKSMQEQMEDLGWEVEIADSMSVEDGIRLVREMLPTTFIDATRCADKDDGEDKSTGLITHMKQYARNKTGHPIHDEHSHACDMVRYIAAHAPKMHNNRTQWGGKINYPSLGRGRRQ